MSRHHSLKFFIGFLSLLVLVLFLGASVRGVDEIFGDGFESGDTLAWSYDTTRPIRVLFVGNSYTSANNLSSIVAQLSQSPGAGRLIITDKVAPGGFTWELHSASAATLAKIDEGWDYVVLQDQSLQPIYSPTVLKSAAEVLDARIRAAGGQTVLFMTWPRAYHDLQTQHYYPLYYNNHGAHLDAEVTPVGRAWVQSLYENPALTLHAADNSHPAARGTYLTAAVFYATLNGQSPVGLTGGTLGLPEADREFLQSVAWATYVGSLSPTAPVQVHCRLSSTAVEDYFMTPGLTIGDHTGPFGAPDGATSFDGNGLVSVPYTPRVKPVEELTLSIFVYRDDWSTPTGSDEVMAANDNAFALYQNGAMIYGKVRTINSGAVVAPFDVTGLAAGWHHFAVTYDGTAVSLWHQGAVVASAAASGLLDHGPGAGMEYTSLTLASSGAFPGPGSAVSGFSGALADFRLYHHVLTAAEIGQLVVP